MTYCQVEGSMMLFRFTQYSYLIKFIYLKQGIFIRVLLIFEEREIFTRRFIASAFETREFCG